MDSRLKQLRKKKGFTQIQMQMHADIDQSDYSKLERGTRYPTMEQAKRLSQVLETSIDYIAGVTDIPDPYPKSKN